MSGLLIGYMRLPTDKSDRFNPFAPHSFKRLHKHWPGLLLVAIVGGAALAVGSAVAGVAAGALGTGAAAVLSVLA